MIAISTLLWGLLVLIGLVVAAFGLLAGFASQMASSPDDHTGKVGCGMLLGGLALLALGLFKVLT